MVSSFLVEYMVQREQEIKKKTHKKNECKDVIKH
jgi:hypothetical protein